MLILGGFLGYVVCFFLVATPLAGVLAAQLGVALVIPVVGIAISPVFTPPLVVIAVVHIILVLVLYLIASVAVRSNIPAGATDLAAGPLPAATAGAPPAPWQNWERLARGALIGQNACFTMLLTWTLLPWLFQWMPVVGPALLLSSNLLAIAGIVIGFANLMALDESVCADRNYAAFMGWTSWVAAGSTLVNLLGTLFWLLSVVASWLGVRLVSVTPEWWTGTWVVHGGPMFLTILPASWVTALGLSPIPTAYNLGTFLFVDGSLGATSPSVFKLPAGGGALMQGGTAVGLTFHETGHTLNLASFGSWFHAIGAIDENVVQGAIGSTGLSTYSEILPEGHARDSTRPWFPLWAPPVGPVGTTSNVPPTAGTATVNGAFPNAAAASIVVAAGSTLTLASAGAADPDTFPQGLVGPGATPPLGTLWDLPVLPAGSAAVVAGPFLANTTAAIDIGGDYSVAFALTDGIQLAGGADVVLLGAGLAGAAEFGVSAVQAIISGPTVVGIGASITLSAASSTAGTAGVAVAPPGGGGPPLLLFAWTTNGGAALTLTPGATPELIVVQRNGAGNFTVTLTATEQFTGTSVSHSTTTPIT
jgi:hypothetical protein